MVDYYLGQMKKSANLGNVKIEQTTVLEDSVLEGDIILSGGLCLFGKIVGNVIAGSRVEVWKGALITGNLSCKELYIAGTVEGNIEAHVLTVDENAVLRGKVEVSRLCLKAEKYDMKQLRLIRK